MPTLTVQDYQIGWICALSKEMSAALAMLDEEYEMIAEQDPQDHNSYVLGRIHQHHVVIACMPEGVDGLVPAATVAKDMARTFPALRFGLMVGIGGGIPDLANSVDIRLGDVVVSKPDKTLGGVVQYDKGKAENGGKFVRKGQLNQPPTLLLQTLTQLCARHRIRSSKMSDYMKDAIERNPMMEETGFTFPSESDCFYCSGCDRDVESPATDCQRFHGKRKQRVNNNPVAHYGLIASGNQVVKDAAVRDRLQAEFGALCVEMEAAGLMNEFPCLVIRGICDYADRHKNDGWHSYAAMTAAAYAKELLSYISRAQASQERPLEQIIGLLDGLHQTSEKQTIIDQKHLQATEAQTLQHKMNYESDLYRKCHQTFKLGPYEEQKDINPSRAANTCKWVLNHPQYQHWSETLRDDLIWISADPGCGKSVLAKSLVDNELRNTGSHTICYFFFKDTEEQDYLSVALCAILHQLFTHRPQLIRHAIDIHNKSGNKITKDLSELWRIWLAAARDPEAGIVTCVLDALDECREDDRRLLINMLVTFYNGTSTASSRHGHIKFLVTSRPYDDIQYHFGKVAKDLPVIRLRGEDENDTIHDEIDSVVRLKVSEMAAEFKLEPSAVEQLAAKILDMQHRTYLWLYLAIGSIRATYRDSLQPNRVVIDSLPSSVEAAYEGILNKVAERQRPTALLILEIIVGARRPLTIGEMALALGASGTSPDSSLLANGSIDVSHLKRQIRVWCGLFIFVNDSRLYLIHQTAKEFLLKTSDLETVGVHQWKHCLDSMIVERNMTVICARFLLRSDTVKSRRKAYIERTEGNYYGIVRKSKFHGDIGSFMGYSSENWPSHLRNAHITDRDLIQYLLPLYDTDSFVFRRWFPLLWHSLKPYESLPPMNSIRLASFLGHEEALKFALENDQHRINEADDWDRTALYWASKFGHTQIVRILLARGAHFNPGYERRFRGPLFAAAEEGHSDVVMTLLENGAEVDARENGSVLNDYDTALHAAVRGCHTDTVKILLKNGADVQLSGNFRWTPLHLATQKNFVPIMKILIESGANVNAHDWQGKTPLHISVERGQVEAAQVLLDAGADVHAYNSEWSRPLHVAVDEGQVELAQMLLDAGADRYDAKKDGKSALEIARERRNDKMYELFDL